MPVRTAVEMRDQVFENLEPAGIVIKAAAVADFHLSKVPDQKVKKTAARISLELDPTPDILAELGRKKGDRLLIGFAAETQNLQQEARRKLESKNCDMVVGNLVGGADVRLRIRPERSGPGAAHGRNHSPAPRLQARDRRPHLRRGPETPPGPARRQWTLNRYASIWSSTRTWASRTLYRPAPAPLSANRAATAEAAAGPSSNRAAARCPTATPCSESSTTSAIAAAAACTKGRNKIVFGVGNEQSAAGVRGRRPGRG